MKLVTFSSTLALLAAALAPAAGALPLLEERSVAQQAGIYLLRYQNADGSWPHQIEPTRDACGCQNVAGVTALGVLRAWQVAPPSPANLHMRDAAGKTFDYLAGIHAASETNILAAPNVYFMVEYAIVTGDLADIDLARAVYARALSYHGGPAALTHAVLDARAAQGIPNVGFWDAGLWAQAAGSAGFRADASEVAAAMRARLTELDPAKDGYALGLSGVVETHARSNVDNVQRARAYAAALKDAADADGGYGDVQTTSYAAMALYAVGETSAARDASSWVHARWDSAGGGWPEDGLEFGEVTSEAIQALATAVLPAPALVTSNAVSVAASGWSYLQGEPPAPEAGTVQADVSGAAANHGENPADLPTEGASSAALFVDTSSGEFGLTPPDAGAVDGLLAYGGFLAGGMSGTAGLWGSASAAGQGCSFQTWGGDVDPALAPTVTCG